MNAILEQQFNRVFASQLKWKTCDVSQMVFAKGNSRNEYWINPKQGKFLLKMLSYGLEEKTIGIFPTEKAAMNKAEVLESEA